MLQINPLNTRSTTFQANLSNKKFATQKLEKALQDNKLPQVIREGLKDKNKSINPLADNLKNFTTPKAQVIDDVGIFMAKRAPQEYAITSAKLAEQKGQKLSLVL